ncbi:MAG: hypothetical protein ABR520_04950 [Mycobacteriales bacterium]|nr:hypothetical protein [Frankia sp.]
MVTTYAVWASVRIVPNRQHPFPTPIPDALDQVMAHMLSLEDEQLRDTSIAMTLDGEGATVEIEALVDAYNVGQAYARLSTDIRASLHAAEIGTANWGQGADPFVDAGFEADLPQIRGMVSAQ